MNRKIYKIYPLKIYIMFYRLIFFVCLIAMGSLSAFDSEEGHNKYFMMSFDPKHVFLTAVRQDNVSFFKEQYSRFTPCREMGTGNLPLHIAAQSRSYKISNLLLNRYNEDQAALNGARNTALYEAAVAPFGEAYFRTLDTFLCHSAAGKAALIGYKNNRSALDCIDYRLTKELEYNDYDVAFAEKLKQRKSIMLYRALCYIASVMGRRGSLCESIKYRKEFYPALAKLCALGVDINAPLDIDAHFNKVGPTMLFHVCETTPANVTKILELLLAHKANPRITFDRLSSGCKITPLHVACQVSSFAAIAVLLRHDPTLLYTEDSNGRTPIVHMQEHEHLKAVSIFLQNYAANNQEERAHLQEKATRGFFGHYYGARAKFVKSKEHHKAQMRFIEANADRKGYPLLHKALKGSKRIYYNSEDIGKAELLLEGGADPNKGDRKKRTALHAACIFESRKFMSVLVPLLVRYGADLNAQTDKGHTPLHAAVNHMKIFSDSHEMYESPDPALRALIKGGADPNVKDANGWTPLYHAVNIIRDNGKIIGFAHPTFSSPPPIKVKIPLNFEDFECLLQGGADVYAKTNDGDTPMQVITGMLKHAPLGLPITASEELHQYGLRKDRDFLEQLAKLFSLYRDKEVPSLQTLCLRVLGPVLS